MNYIAAVVCGAGTAFVGVALGVEVWKVMIIYMIGYAAGRLIVPIFDKD